MYYNLIQIHIHAAGLFIRLLIQLLVVHPLKNSWGLKTTANNVLQGKLMELKETSGFIKK